jgi:4-hydroxythreonine-4-phosphate dehydrogenase
MAKRIVITSGDVNGIGLRCLARALTQQHFEAEISLAISPSVLKYALNVYDLPGSVDDSVWTLHNQSVSIVPLTQTCSITPGIPDPDVSRHAIASLECAITHTVTGDYDAVVTLPINKHALTSVGWPYAGQTEMLGAYSNGEPLMVLCTHDVRVALTTVHVPLRDVSNLITSELVQRRTQQLIQHLRDRIGIADPSIAILAVNPHAGDDGVIGDEDTRIVAPAIATMQQQGLNVSGPHPADGFFAFGAYTNYDGILAMYHDQGLIPLKLLAKGAGVNVTAGLSIIRTSPDHGTAYDRALSSDIDSSSTELAIEMAIGRG